MIRPWGRMLLLVLVVLTQMACPHNALQPTNQDLSSPTEMYHPWERPSYGPNANE